MIAASAADLDGLGIVIGQCFYWEYHHTLGHNLFFGMLVSLTLAGFSSKWFRAFAAYVLLFHLHLVLDYFGSGPGWHIHYLWPVGSFLLKNSSAWEFYSWQNLLAAFLFLGWMVWIAFRDGRTPLELISPRLDHEAIVWLHGNKQGHA